MCLPESLAQLTNLQKLDVSGCGLQEIPQSVTQLKSLTELNLQLVTKVLHLYLNHWHNSRNLQKLDVSCCGLQEIPQSVTQLKSLTELNLHR